MSSQVKFEIEDEAYSSIKNALQKYGKLEIGGILIGYQKGKNHFSIARATVADDIGKFNVASFIREPFKSMTMLLKLFKKRKYNYLGEWHSHPSFSLNPSSNDIRTMKGIILDDAYGVSFALLIIVKMLGSNIEMAGYLFHIHLGNFVEANVVIGGLNHER